MKNNFIKCGLTGWCMEIIFTSMESLVHRDGKLIGQTSLWMFPIYSSAALLKPVCRLLKNKPPLIRGGIYSIAIFSFEYLSGSLLKKHDLCPWDYSRAKTSINGLVRLDYLPFWMAAGLIFERILAHSSSAQA